MIAIVAVEDVLERLDAFDCHPRRRPAGHHIAWCPAHVGRRRSLDVSAGRDGRTLVHCLAGCVYEDVCDALGFDSRALSPFSVERLCSSDVSSPGKPLAPLQALEWECVDLASGVIRAEKGWDRCEGEAIAPKSEKGRRSVPIAGVLRNLLTEHRMRCPWDDGLVFGRTATLPFSDSGMRDRAGTAWKHAKLEPIGFHEARHSFASLMIAAGVNAKALSTFMGHANISITLDLYGHLFPGAEAEAAGLLDAYLKRSEQQARAADPRDTARDNGHPSPAVLSGS